MNQSKINTIITISLVFAFSAIQAMETVQKKPILLFVRNKKEVSYHAFGSFKSGERFSKDIKEKSETQFHVGPGSKFPLNIRISNSGHGYEFDFNESEITNNTIKITLEPFKIPSNAKREVCFEAPRT